MSGLIERVVRINGEERQRSQVPYEHTRIEQIVLPVCTITPPLLTGASIELELTFDPPLVAAPAPAEEERR